VVENLKMQTLLLNKWGLTVRIWKNSDYTGKEIVLLLHGLSGDENSMSVFLNKLPQKYIFLSPRGIFPIFGGGYSWVENNNSNVLKIETFNPAIKILDNLVEGFCREHECLREYHIIGFSQGAALAFSLLLYKPEPIISLASLAGFVPDGVDVQNDSMCYKYKNIYITHGIEDDLVPIEKARKARDLFISSGANVTYCEDLTGHKLSIKCFDGLSNFYTTLSVH
jgi:phospholipase/carboxylesterase